MWKEIFSNVDMIIQCAGITITAIATIVLAWMTYRYVKLTNHMLAETRALRGPTIYVDLEMDVFLVILIIGNSGSGPAHNISFNVKESIPWRESKNLIGISNLSPIKEGVSYLAPGRILKYNAGYLDWDKLKELDCIISFNIEYDDHLRKHHNFKFLIDMGQYDGIRFESFKNPASEIAGAIRKIEDARRSDKTIGRITSSWGSKKCPICGERISVDAKKCPHCMEFLSEEK